MNQHLDALRGILRQLDPTQPIMTQAQRAWYVERPNAIGAALGRTLQLEPSSSHLVVGSIGCGKSTELLHAGRLLVQTPGIFARYVDVSTRMALDQADAVTLALAVASDLSDELASRFPSNEVEAFRTKLAPHLQGYLDPYHDRDDYIPDEWVPPRLVPPSDIGDLASFAWVLEGVQTLLSARGSVVVCLIDGLDRLWEVEKFDSIVDPFLAAAKRVGIGVAITGPARAIAGLDRLGVAERFDERHVMGPVDIVQDAGRTFLHDVLAARGVCAVMGEPEIRSLVEWSGGAIRVALQLAREAIKESWIQNAERVQAAHVSAAADRVGRGLLLGLTDDDMTRLRALHETGRFGVRAPPDAALVLSNRILQYQMPGGMVRHALHPTLIPFVETWMGDSAGEDARA